MSTAFVLAPGCNSRFITGHSSITTKKLAKTSLPTTPRRSTIVNDAGGTDKTEQPKSESNKNGDGDDNMSDLVLPELRSLFSSAGDPDCETCHGEGEISCVLCDGKGFFSITMMDTVSSTQCRLCRGKKVMPCPSCRKEVYKSVLWWDLIPSKEDDPEEKWREGPDGEPRISWGDNPANPPR